MNNRFNRSSLVKAFFPRAWYNGFPVLSTGLLYTATGGIAQSVAYTDHTLGKDDSLSMADLKGIAFSWALPKVKSLAPGFSPDAPEAVSTALYRALDSAPDVSGYNSVQIFFSIDEQFGSIMAYVRSL